MCIEGDSAIQSTFTSTYKFQSALGASMKLQPALYSNQSDFNNTISVKDVQYAHYTSIINKQSGTLKFSPTSEKHT